MSGKEFGDLVSRRMIEKDISQRRLAARLGELPDGTLFDSTGIRVLKEGKRRLTRNLVARLIDLLDLDPDEAWATAGLLPPEVSADELRQLRRFRDDLARAATTVPAPSDPP
jgi:transcriptional regulator with XRE-family HTH domain